MATSQPKILVVDDTEANIKLLRALLRGAGYEVVTAACGTEALTAAASEDPDLILLDIMMPDITGFEVCQRLRAAPETRQTPIVFLTALHEMEDHMKGMDVGGDDVLTKPINKLELLTRVKSLLRVRALATEVSAQRRLIHDLLNAYVSAEAAQRYLADPASVLSLERLTSSLGKAG
ncbi:MAG: response regulator [candidate division NC10 bacterium]|nr:response regulator [candidate division NC10 bacterium]